MRWLGAVVLLLCACTGDDDDSVGSDAGTVDGGTTAGMCAASCFPACFAGKIGDCNGAGATSCMLQFDLTNPQNPGSNLCYSNGFKIRVRGSSPALSQFFKNGAQCGYTSEATGAGSGSLMVQFKDAAGTFATFSNIDSGGRKFTVTCAGGTPVAVDLTTADCTGCGSFGSAPCPQGACVIP